MILTKQLIPSLTDICLMDWRVTHMTKQLIIGSVRLVLFWTFQNCLLVLKRKISFPTKVEISRISSPNSFPSLSCHPGCHHFISIWDQGGDQGKEIFWVPLSPVQCFVHLSCCLLLYWNNTGVVKPQIESSVGRWEIVIQKSLTSKGNPSPSSPSLSLIAFAWNSFLLFTRQSDLKKK